MRRRRPLVLLLCVALVFGGALACDLGGAKRPTPVSEVAVPPLATETVLTPTPTPSLVTLSDGSQVPLPGDAELMPVVEGFTIGFTTGLAEPQVFDFYAAWLSQRGWVFVPPTEAVVSQPHQRWRKGDLDLLIELQSPDERGRTVAWLQVSSPTPPSPTAPMDIVGVLTAPTPSVPATTQPVAPVPTLAPSATGGWINYSSADGLAGDFANDLVIDSRGWVWVATNGGVSVFDGQSWRTHGLADGLPSQNVQAIAIDPQGRVWCGTDKGLAMFAGQGWASWSIAKGLVADNVRALYISPNGVVWYGTPEGAGSFDGQQWHEITTENGLSSNEVHAIVGDLQGNIWFGVKHPYLIDVVFTSGQWRHFGYQEGMSLGVYTGALAVDGQGRIWAGVMDRMAIQGWLNLYDGQTWHAYPAIGGYTGLPVFDIAFGPAGDAWLATSPIGLLHWLDEKTVVNVSEGMADTRARAVAVAPDGSVWVATGAGVSRYSEKVGLPSAMPVPATKPPTAVPPTPTAWIPPQPTPPEGVPVTGGYAQVWERLGGVEGPLGQPLDPPVEKFYAIQRFEHGLMHWGRLDRMGEPEPEVQIILYGLGDNRQAGQEWYRDTDYWREGDAEYPCPQAGPPWGPRRGFGKVWCEYEYCRDHLGVPVEGEWGEQGGYQDFQGGVMLRVPKEGGIYVLLNRGDWRFEPVQ